jgi:hypothetical protein
MMDRPFRTDKTILTAPIDGGLATHLAILVSA